MTPPRPECACQIENDFEPSEDRMRMLCQPRIVHCPRHQACWEAMKKIENPRAYLEAVKECLSVLKGMADEVCCQTPGCTEENPSCSTMEARSALTRLEAARQ